MLGPSRRLAGRRPPGPLGRCLDLTWGLFLLALPSSLYAATPLRQVPAVVHVHSTWSSGAQTLDDLIARARAGGIGVIFLTDNHLHRFEYGLAPLRNLLRYRVEYPSLLQRGPEAYLTAVREANARQKDVLLIPGAEVIPQYYWTGSLLQGTLTMHNAQKNLLIFGLARAEDYRALPAVGNPNAARFGLASLWLLSPAVLALPGVWLLRIRRPEKVRLRHFRVTVERRFTGYGVLCLGIGAVLLANNFPFRTPAVSPYDSAAGLRPYQAVIDFTASRGGFTAWSLPESSDYQVVSVWKLRATIRTEPYADDLLSTDRFTAFGGVYEDRVTFTEPGAGWDRLLAGHLEGRRSAPAWAIGEAAYHREGHAGKRLGDVQTVFLVEHKDTASLLAALRAGRLYALQRTPEVGLGLEVFQVLVPDRPPGEAGDMVSARVGDRPEVVADLQATDGRRMEIQVRLVRGGSVVHTLRGETPLTIRWTDAALPDGAKAFYRLEARGPGGHWILSNPIFVRVMREDRR
jgi:hypothetical protein